jgi:hypothetical protein
MLLNFFPPDTFSFSMGDEGIVALVYLSWIKITQRVNVLSQNMPGRNEENYEKPLLRR